MKIRRTLTATFAAVLILVCMGVVNADELIVEFADSAWDGVTIPKGQHCKKFGGDGSTPPSTGFQHTGRGQCNRR